MRGKARVDRVVKAVGEKDEAVARRRRRAKSVCFIVGRRCRERGGLDMGVSCDVGRDGT